ncbi:MAG: DNA replication and repair protein RecF [bacterium]|nr:DNA replication and repair protein RecF [Candidatus Minthenecus merdequi]
MNLVRLNCLNYRNIEECDIELSPKFNCFLGNNGVGKTNLIDAVYFMSLTKSHLNSVDAQLVRHGESFLMLQGEYDNDGKSEIIQATVKPHVRKILKRNGKIYNRMSDHIGLIPVVLISPVDQQMITDGSEERRRFMDTVISQCDARYLNSLTRYNSVLKNRNDLLKKLSDGIMTDEADPLLDIFDCQMSNEAKYIYKKRYEFIDEFIPFFDKIYQDICSEREQVELKYTSHCENGELTALLRECRNRDIAVGYTTRGIHKDDLIMNIEGFPIKTTGSQGQNKTFVTAMKLAQYLYLSKCRGVKPILLLDDVFDRLDSNRVINIIRIVSSDEFGQIFITDTSRNHTDNLLAHTVNTPFRVFNVNDGKVTSCSETSL